MAKKPVITEYEITSPKIKETMTIAHVSDIHERNMDDIIVLLKTVKPDMIAVSGDTFERYSEESSRAGVLPGYNVIRRGIVCVIYFINYVLMKTFYRKNQPDTGFAYAFFQKASKIAPVYLSLGNHDEALEPQDLQVLKENGITLLDNAEILAAVRQNRLYIGGLSTDYDRDWLQRFSGHSGFKLLLSHHPEYFEPVILPRDIDLTLSGHNHGGQIKLFGRGVMSAEKKLFPKLDSGFFFNRLVVSAGCCNTAAIPRWGNPCELVVIHLKPQ